MVGPSSVTNDPYSAHQGANRPNWALPQALTSLTVNISESPKRVNPDTYRGSGEAPKGVDSKTKKSGAAVPTGRSSPDTF